MYSSLAPQFELKHRQRRQDIQLEDRRIGIQQERNFELRRGGVPASAYNKQEEKRWLVVVGSQT
ncbi:hypothetical protein TELCIR_20374, partial [Teladorsagia circumcincta]